MKKTTKINATLILVLILMSLNSMQINSLITGEKLDNLNNCKTETGESFIESKITAKNDYDYTISGPTGEVSHPKIAYTDNDQIIIVWREDGSLFKISKYTSNL
nr:hypothetical protein [Asgard group archaeon]